MAENEILDVGNGWHFRKWRRALNNPTLNEQEKADTFRDEVLSCTQKVLQGEPLFSVLKACKQSPEMLREVIAKFKCRDLAMLVKRAYEQDISANPMALAMSVVDNMIDQYQDRAKQYALTNAENQQQEWHENLQKAINTNLEGCRADLTQLISLSLTNVEKPKVRRKTGNPRSSREVVDRSLIKPSQPQAPEERRHV